MFNWITSCMFATFCIYVCTLNKLKKQTKKMPTLESSVLKDLITDGATSIRVSARHPDNLLWETWKISCLRQLEKLPKKIYFHLKAARVCQNHSAIFFAPCYCGKVISCSLRNGISTVWVTFSCQTKYFNNSISLVNKI